MELVVEGFFSEIPQSRCTFIFVNAYKFLVVLLVTLTPACTLEPFIQLLTYVICKLLSRPKLSRGTNTLLLMDIIILGRGADYIYLRFPLQYPWDQVSSCSIIVIVIIIVVAIGIGVTDAIVFTVIIIISVFLNVRGSGPLCIHRVGESSVRDVDGDDNETDDRNDDVDVVSLFPCAKSLMTWTYIQRFLQTKEEEDNSS